MTKSAKANPGPQETLMKIDPHLAQFLTEVFKSKSEERRNNKGRKCEIVRFIRTLEAWQMVKMLADDGRVCGNISATGQD